VSFECVDGGVVINFFGVGGVENFWEFFVVMMALFW